MRASTTTTTTTTPPPSQVEPEQSPGVLASGVVVPGVAPRRGRAGSKRAMTVTRFETRWAAAAATTTNLRPTTSCTAMWLLPAPSAPTTLSWEAAAVAAAVEPLSRAGRVSCRLR